VRAELNLVLIPVIGLNGAAVATLLSYALATYFSFAVTQRTRPMFWLMTRLLNPVNLVKSILKH
jgi:Na+-driven multidrug efflux pump